MTKESGLAYGVDGYPYFLGLGVAGAALTALAVRLGRSRRPRVQRAAVVLAVAAVGATVPNVAGAVYVLHGKLRLRDRVLDQVSWRGDEAVADLGSGLGLLAIGATARTTGTVHCVDLFVGKDLAGNTPARLLRNATRHGVVGQLEVRRDDVRAMPLADRSIDVVVSSLCLHNIPGADGRAMALDEIVRIVRPGGTVVISDLAHVDEEYAPALRRGGFRVETLGRVPETFPIQRMLVARREP